jgi:hypothetical protein
MATSETYSAGRDSKHYRMIHPKNAGAICKNTGLRLVAGQGISVDQGDFKSIIEVGPEPTVAPYRHGEDIEHMEDG